MNSLIKIEEAAMFLACLVVFPHLEISWWWFAGCILLPDVSMAGYLINPKTGAYLYNLFHHKGVAILMLVFGFLLSNVWIEFTGLLLFAHASMDRMLGYGLKYEKGFKYTHLGLIGKEKEISNA